MLPQAQGTELLPLIQSGDTILVDARLLHQKLQIRSKFMDWIVTKIRDYKFEEKKDYYTEVRSEKKEHSVRNREYTSYNYHITVDMAKELAMLERNEIGRDIRRYFIQAEKQARAGITIAPLPDTKALFKALPTERINGRVLYPYKEVCQLLGLSTNSGSYDKRKAVYAQHFIRVGHPFYITSEFAAHLHLTCSVNVNRQKIKNMQPILPQGFGDTAGLLTP